MEFLFFVAWIKDKFFVFTKWRITILYDLWLIVGQNFFFYFYFSTRWRVIIMQIIKVSMYQLKISINLWLTRQNITVKIFYSILVTIFFLAQKILECHVEYFISINDTKSVLLTEENEHVNFQNFKRLTISPFIIYTIYNNTTSCNNTTTCYEWKRSW